MCDEQLRKAAGHIRRADGCRRLCPLSRATWGSGGWLCLQFQPFGLHSKHLGPPGANLGLPLTNRLSISSSWSASFDAPLQINPSGTNCDPSVDDDGHHAWLCSRHHAAKYVNWQSLNSAGILRGPQRITSDRLLTRHLTELIQSLYLIASLTSTNDEFLRCIIRVALA